VTGGEEDSGAMESKMGMGRARGEVSALEEEGSDTCNGELDHRKEHPQKRSHQENDISDEKQDHNTYWLWT
jgi:hypothetical protein